MTLNLNALPDYLKNQRWFAGKAWPIKKVSVVDHALLAGTRIEGAAGPPSLAVVEVLYELGAPERYLLPVVPREDGRPLDASEDDSVGRAIFRLIRRNQRLQEGSATLVGEAIPGAEPLLAGVSENPSVRRLGAEQSNTSVVLDEKVILKLIRKLEAGVSPEHEIGRFLMTRTGFREAPPLLGALHLVGQSTTTIAVAHQFVRGTQDGWQWLLEQLRGGQAGSEGLFASLGELGRTVARLHLALGSADDDPAFAPEPLLTEDVQRWSSSIVGELGVTISQANARFPQLLERHQALTERAKRLVTCCAGGKKIRLHGDLHLGQVLRDGDRWLVFDFEGEPGRGFAQRREKHTPLKDVAGVLRSFSYAAATVARGGQPVPGFERRARGAFLGGYHQEMAGSDLLPTTEEDGRALLDAMELEKALYEVRYEINNRPDWADIPVAVLLEEAR